MRLNPDQRARLLAALNDAFPTVASAEELALMATNKSLDQVALGADLSERIGVMIRRAEEEGWVARLLDQAILLRPEVAPLKALRVEFAALIVAERADHFAACRLLGNNFLVNRDSLRAGLHELADEESGIHIMAVQGPRGSGRTHSFQLVRYLAERIGFKVVWLDMEERVRRAEAGKLEPEDLGRAIVDQMGGLDLTHWPERQGEQAARWNLRFCDWLTGLLKTSDCTCWIVLDSFDRVLLQEGVEDLVRLLAARIETNLSQLRLVLLGYQDERLEELRPLVSGGLDEDMLTPQQRIGETDLLNFFIKLYEERLSRDGADLSSPQVRDKIVTGAATSTQTVMQQVDFTNEQHLRQLGPAVGREGRRVWSEGAGG